MENYPMNMWLITENEFESFTFTGGKVVYIVEEAEPRYASHPAIITAGALLPPCEAISMELDGNYGEAEAIYDYYLQTPEADPFISILVAAAVSCNPVGIMFGKDELNMKFPSMLINYLYRNYGIVLGVQNQVVPYIMIEAMPFVLAKLYNANIIDYQTFMMKHPPLPIHPSVISKMAYEQNPAVQVKDFENYMNYFERIKNEIYNNGGKFLVDPFIGI